MTRGQVPLPLVEAGIGSLLLLVVVILLAGGVANPETPEAQLDAYADDAGELLRQDPPRHQNDTRLAEVAASRAAFQREKAALSRRAERLLPPNLLYRIQTEHGSAGFQQPTDTPIGQTKVLTRYGTVTITVWYA